MDAQTHNVHTHHTSMAQLASQQHITVIEAAMKFFQGSGKIGPIRPGGWGYTPYTMDISRKKKPLEALVTTGGGPPPSPPGAGALAIKDVRAPREPARPAGSSTDPPPPPPPPPAPPGGGKVKVKKPMKRPSAPKPPPQPPAP